MSLIPTNNMLFHTHKFIKDGDIIFCESCGKVKTIPCNHEFEIIKEIENHMRGYDNPVSRTYVSRCTKCGEINQTIVGA